MLLRISHSLTHLLTHNVEDYDDDVDDDDSDECVATLIEHKTNMLNC